MGEVLPQWGEGEEVVLMAEPPADIPLQPLLTLPLACRLKTLSKNWYLFSLVSWILMDSSAASSPSSPLASQGLGLRLQLLTRGCWTRRVAASCSRLG